MAVRCKAHAHLKSAEKPTDCRLCVFDLKERIAELEGKSTTGATAQQGEPLEQPKSPSGDSEEKKPTTA